MNYIFSFFFQASQYGFLHLHDIAAEERKRLPPLVIPTFDNKSPKYVDHISDTYLKQCNVSNLGTPYKVQTMVAVCLTLFLYHFVGHKTWQQNSVCAHV